MNIFVETILGLKHMYWEMSLLIISRGSWIWHGGLSFGKYCWCNGGEYAASCKGGNIWVCGVMGSGPDLGPKRFWVFMGWYLYKQNNEFHFESIYIIEINNNFLGFVIFVKIGKMDIYRSIFLFVPIPVFYFRKNK